MARPTRSQQSRFRSLIAGLEPAMRRAFQQAVAGLYQGINWRGFLDALRMRDVDRAITAMNIDPAAFSGLYQTYQSAFTAGAQETVATLSISGVTRQDAIGIRFDMTNPRAEGMLASQAGAMITEITEDSRNAVRETILQGYTQGRGPRDIATDVVGRVVNGRREGGVLGIDSGRAHRLTMVTDGMRTADGVKGLVIKHRDGTYSLRYKVNAATEKAILAAYHKGTAVPEKTRERVGNQFRNALLKSRGDTVARLETATAVMAGKIEEWNQVLDKLGRSPDDVIKTFQHGAGGADPRWWHVAANGMQVHGLHTPFVLANGAQIQCAHDPAAPIGETANCTCSTTFRLKVRKEDLL